MFLLLPETKENWIKITSCLSPTYNGETRIDKVIINITDFPLKQTKRSRQIAGIDSCNSEMPQGKCCCVFWLWSQGIIFVFWLGFSSPPQKTFPNAKFLSLFVCGFFIHCSPLIFTLLYGLLLLSSEMLSFLWKLLCLQLRSCLSLLPPIESWHTEDFLLLKF